MTLMQSKMLALGTKAINFDLMNIIDNKRIKLFSYAKNRPIVLAFICNHCPYVKHLLDCLAFIGNQYTRKGFAFIAISSNDVEQVPEDSPRKMKKLAFKKGLIFPYCYDEKQEAAKNYEVLCTPDFYCFDQQHILVYRGQFDASRPGNKIPVTGCELTSAMDLVLKNRLFRTDSLQVPSIGCSIKWRNAKINYI